MYNLDIELKPVSASQTQNVELKYEYLENPIIHIWNDKLYVIKHPDNTISNYLNEKTGTYKKVESEFRLYVKPNTKYVGTIHFINRDGDVLILKYATIRHVNNQEIKDQFNNYINGFVLVKMKPSYRIAKLNKRKIINQIFNVKY